MWARSHPCNATAPDPVGQPDNFELVSAPHFLPRHFTDVFCSVFGYTVGRRDDHRTQ
jgi:hypothetical protein